MNLPIPDFIPVPSPEIMLTISVVLLTAGICLVVSGTCFLFFRKQKKKTTVIPWVCICAGILLAVNHAIQLLCKL